MAQSLDLGIQNVYIIYRSSIKYYRVIVTLMSTAHTNGTAASRACRFRLFAQCVC